MAKQVKSIEKRIKRIDKTKEKITNGSIIYFDESNIDKKYVCPLGKIVGIKATTDGILVIGYEEENNSHSSRIWRQIRYIR